MLPRRLVVLFGLAAFPLLLGLAFDAFGVAGSGQSLPLLAGVPAALGAIWAVPVTLVADRPVTGRARVHLIECLGAYLWLGFAALMQGEGLTARGGIFFGAVALGSIVANAAVLRFAHSAAQAA